MSFAALAKGLWLESLALDGVANFLQIFLSMGSLLRMQIERVVIALEASSRNVSPQQWWECRDLWDVYFLKFKELTECLWDNYLKPLTSECARKDIQQEFGQDLEAIHELCDAMILYRERIEKVRCEKCVHRREPDGRKILQAVRDRGAQREFDAGGSLDFFLMLENQIAGRTDSWAVRWYGSLWMHGGLALHPGRSLVRNTGFDGSGENSGSSGTWDVELSTEPVTRFPAAVEEDASAFKAIVAYRKRAAWKRQFEAMQHKLRRWVS